jgi:hypothetical protein
MNKLGLKSAMEKELLQFILPEGLLSHFDVIEILLLCDIKSKKEFFEIVLEEQNKILLPVDVIQYESKGFTEVTLQDFPLRGKPTYLRIRRRRWRHKQDPKNIIRNDFSFVAEGAGFTQELSDFLKDTSGYERRYNNQHR